MAIRFDHQHERFGFRALVLENDLLRIEVLPELGGKIWSIVYKPRDRELLWHHPELAPQRSQPGDSFDDAFAGGWDELFPNDAPVMIDGVAYPDHGELWTAECSWELLPAADDELCLALSALGSITGAAIERKLTLRDGEAAFTIAYEVRGEQPLQAHWKMHPAFRLGPHASVEIPAKRVILDPEFAHGFAEFEGNWPFVRGTNGETIDLRELPHPSTRATRFFYATELTEGWAALTDLDNELTIRLDFDPVLFPAVTLFGTYGGWRDLHTTILEPCTGYPYRLDQAIAAGRATVITPEEPFKTVVRCSVLAG